MDEDALRMEHSNDSCATSRRQRRGYRMIDFAVIRPSQDLGKLAAGFEPQLPDIPLPDPQPRHARDLQADFMSLFMFVPGYLKRLIEIGEADAEAKIEEITRVGGRG